MKIGLAIQLVCFGLFLLISFRFYFVSRHFRDHWPDQLWIRFLWALNLSACLVFVRSRICFFPMANLRGESFSNLGHRFAQYIEWSSFALGSTAIWPRMSGIFMSSRSPSSFLFSFSSISGTQRIICLKQGGSRNEPVMSSSWMTDQIPIARRRYWVRGHVGKLYSHTKMERYLGDIYLLAVLLWGVLECSEVLRASDLCFAALYSRMDGMDGWMDDCPGTKEWSGRVYNLAPPRRWLDAAKIAAKHTAKFSRRAAHSLVVVIFQITWIFDGDSHAAFPLSYGLFSHCFTGFIFTRFILVYRSAVPFPWLILLFSPYRYHCLSLMPIAFPLSDVV